MCVCVCECMSVLVITEVSGTVSNSCESLKFHCDPLGFQQPSLHSKSNTLRPGVFVCGTIFEQVHKQKVPPVIQSPYVNLSSTESQT